MSAPLRTCPTCHAWDPHNCRTCDGDGYIEDDGDGPWEAEAFALREALAMEEARMSMLDMEARAEGECPDLDELEEIWP